MNCVLLLAKLNWFPNVFIMTAHPLIVSCITGFPIGYSVIVALTGLPIGYSVIVALTGLPIGYSVIVMLNKNTLGVKKVRGQKQHCK